MPRTYNVVCGSIRFPIDEFPNTESNSVNPTINCLRTRISHAHGRRLPLNRGRILNGGALQDGHMFNDVYLDHPQCRHYSAEFRPGPLLCVITSQHSPGQLGVAAARPLHENQTVMSLAGYMHLPETALTDAERTCTHQQQEGARYKITQLDDSCSNICRYIQTTENQDEANVEVIWETGVPYIQTCEHVALNVELVCFRVAVANDPVPDAEAEAAAAAAKAAAAAEARKVSDAKAAEAKTAAMARAAAYRAGAGAGDVVIKTEPVA